MASDLVVRGGTVVDGTGRPGYPSDVAIADGRVTDVGPGLRGSVELDASGCIVSPGFIDIHTHYDAQVFWDPALTPSCFHGVTTVVTGNCGFSIAPTRPEHHDTIAGTLERVEDMNVATLAAGIPWDFETFPEYLASVKRRGVGLNFSTYLGHTALRLYIMGDAASERTATDAEIGRMTTLLDEAMIAGAAGFATTFAVTHRGADGRPVPSRFADQAELLALFGAVGRSDRGVIQFSTGDNLPVEDLYDIQPMIGAPISYAPLMTTASGGHWRLLELHRAGWAKGAQVWPQVTCRPVTFSMTLVQPFTLNANQEFGSLMGGSLEARRRAYGDHGWRRRAVEAWRGMVDPLVPRWDTYEIMESPCHRELEGRSLCEIAAERGRSPFDTLLDITLDEPDLELRVRCILMNDDVEDLRLILNEDHCVLGVSDAGAHVGMLCDAPVPTDLLGPWVRDRQVMPIEKAVRMLTGAQADLFNFLDRGYVTTGAWADLVVFDPNTIAPGPIRRVRDFPAGGERLTADQPKGMRHILVNGQPIRRDGSSLEWDPDKAPGQVIGPAPRT